MQGLAARVAVTVSNLRQVCSSAAHTMQVLDIPVLHMHGIISSHNKSHVFEWHVACHAFPGPAGVCMPLIHLQLLSAQLLSGLLRVRRQMRSLFICANNPFVTGFSDIMHEHMHVVLLTTAEVSPLVLAAADRPE